MGSEKTLILVDGHALAFRQYYALERTNMQTSEGLPTWGVYGFFKSIFDLLKNERLKPDAIAVAFDVSHQTFRVEKYPEYKSNRSSMPDPMRVQMELIFEGLRAFNIPIYTKEGFEADDVIGTISKQACELGHKVLILTGDQDAFQLVDKDGCVKVILPSKGELVEYDWEKIYQKLGVYPNQVIDYKALRGDVSDCIPGIKGIGEKTAQKLLDKYKTLDNLLADVENIQEKSIKTKISEGIEIAKLSRYLATIVRDLELNFDFSLTNISVPDAKSVTEFFTRMQFYSFLRNIDSILQTFDKSENEAVPENVQICADNPSQQLGLFSGAVQSEINKFEIKYEKNEIKTKSDFENLLGDIQKSKIFAFKSFADIKSPLEADLRAVAFAINNSLAVFSEENSSLLNGDNTQAYFVSLDVEGLSLEYLLDKLKPLFEDQDIKKITYDLKQEHNLYKSFGISLNSVVFDIELASYVNEPSRNHELDVQAIECINHIMQYNSQFKVDKKKKISVFDIQEDVLFAHSVDVVATIVELAKFWTDKLDEKELELLSKIELPLSIVLADMEYSGVSIDVEYLNELSKTMEVTLSDLEERIFKIAGSEFNLNSPKQVGRVLFEELGLPTKKKRGNKFSTSAEILEELASDYEIVELILQYRKFSKLISTYTESLPELINPKDSRIHTTFNQTITATGRLSSSNPNLQNIPTRTEEGNKIRKAFVPKDRENYLMLSADYSQIELRLLAHISQDPHLTEAFKSGVDVHTLTASKVFGVPVDKVTKDMRYKAKAVNFGIIYGQSRYGLAKNLGITPDEAESFISKYFATYPKVKEFMTNIVNFAQQRGYVESLYGRKRHLEKELNSSNVQIREFAKRAAINHPMQGTAADLIKLAMISLSNKLAENKLESKMIMQVHDELILEVKKTELEQVKSIVLEAMELGQPFEVPLLVDVSVGESWKE